MTALRELVNKHLDAHATVRIFHGNGTGFAEREATFEALRAALPATKSDPLHAVVTEFVAALDASREENARRHALRRASAKTLQFEEPSQQDMRYFAAKALLSAAVPR